MNLYSNTFADGAPLPQRAAFGKRDPDTHVALSDNRSPHLAWRGAPAGTLSYAIVCVDPDVPSVGDDVNQEGRQVPADLARVDFFHWVLVDVPPELDTLDEGADSQGVTPRGKPPGATPHGRRGINDYTGWFAGDPDMAGDYGGYDGPCPPWNDSLVHHYAFTIYALDTATLPLEDGFGGAQVLAALRDHVLASASIVGTYSLAPAAIA